MEPGRQILYVGFTIRGIMCAFNFTDFQVYLLGYCKAHPLNCACFKIIPCLKYDTHFKYKLKVFDKNKLIRLR